MKTKTTVTLLAVLGALALVASAQDNPPSAGSPPADGQPPAQHMGGPGGQRGFHLLPPPAVEQLKLTDDQKKQIAALETETKAKLEKILTADQLQQLKNFRPPMRGGMNRNKGNGSEGGDNSMPPGPPPGEGGNNNPPAGAPPGDK